MFILVIYLYLDVVLLFQLNKVKTQKCDWMTPPLTSTYMPKPPTPHKHRIFPNRLNYLRNYDTFRIFYLTKQAVMMNWKIDMLYIKWGKNWRRRCWFFFYQTRKKMIQFLIHGVLTIGWCYTVRLYLMWCSVYFYVPSIMIACL